MKTLTPEGVDFVAARHLATLSTMAPWGGIHVVPVGFTFVDGLVRIICSGDSQKARNVRRDPAATVSQHEGAQWLTIQGVARVLDEPDDVAYAVALYSDRYRPPRPNPLRVVIALTPTRLMGSAALLTADD